MSSDNPSGRPFLEILNRAETLVSAELRPPQMHRSRVQSMDDWIDTYHSIRRLTQAGYPVFITDNAVGRPEEENLRHLVNNLGDDAQRSRIIPFLTCKHPLDYCLRYAERAYEQQFGTLVVLGGDRHDDVPRCVEHAYQLREMIRSRVPGLALGGWANPHAHAERQAEFLARQRDCSDFFLTQVVSHHSADGVASFLEAVAERGARIPGIFGVFYYRSANTRTLDALRQFFPVPIAGLRSEFHDEGLDPDQICSRSIRSLHSCGVRRIYISNLPVADAPARLERIMDLARRTP